MDLKSFLAKYRGLVAAGHRAKAQRMYMLLDLKPLVAVWQEGRYTSWRSFVIGEQLCAYESFRRFEKATADLKRSLVEEIGVDNAMVLARIEEPLRQPTLAKIRAYIKSFNQVPSFMSTWAFVRALRQTPISVKTKGGKRTLVQRH